MLQHFVTNSQSYLFLSLLFLVFSCGESDQVDTLYGTKEDIATMLKSEDITQRVSINSNGASFHTEKGVQVTMNTNNLFVFEENGNNVTGMIDFEVTELNTKSEILRYGIETRSNHSILASDGEFLFKASQDGNLLRIAEGKKMYLTVPNPTPNPEMEIFFESENTWWPLGDTLEIINSSDLDGFNAYYFGFDRLGWANIDYFTKFDLAYTDISICLPEGYSDDRIEIWIVFKNHDIVLKSYGENLPIGEAIDIICIAAQDEETFRIDIQEATVHVGLKIKLNPQIQSEEQIKALLKELD